MSDKFGVENIKDVARLGVRGWALGYALKDGFQLGQDIDEIVGVTTAVWPAIQDIKLADDEILDMDENERKEIQVFVENMLDELGFVVDDIEAAVVDILNGGLFIARGGLRLAKK